MRQRGVSFKEAINDAVRASASDSAGQRTFRTATASLGESRVNLDRALQVVGEDGELIRKIRSGR